MNKEIPITYLTEKYQEAIKYATFHHKDQTRKQTTIPYISHCLSVSALVLEAGGDEDQSIAGLLHDIAEDCGGEIRLKEIDSFFGERVEKMVRGCSDSLTIDQNNKAPWKIRKQEHLEKLESADHDILLVTGADKTHNARAITTDLQIIGDDIWNRFNAKKEEITWYYQSVYKILEKNKLPDLILKQLSKSINSW
jgi:(p)ppGpp synthase/HD superfamily hydrolase